MLHGVYLEDGPVERLRTFGALLRQDPSFEDRWLCQFDPHYYVVSVSLYGGALMARLDEAFGWHSYPKKHFINLSGSE